MFIKKRMSISSKVIAALGVILIATIGIAPLSLQAQADTEAPANDGVEGVKIKEVGDGEVTLQWDVATDNVGVKGYYVYYADKSVITNSDKDEYDEKVDTGNVITYSVTGLTNDTKYYFAVTAYDAAGNESESYSMEVSATPSASSGAGSGQDSTAPTVALATAANSTTVKIVFSEKVKLPSTNPATAFNVKDVISEKILAVTDAAIDPSDTTGKTVLLTTATQEKGKKYELTVGIAVTDVSGNPIKSGTSDTAVFNGSDATADAKPAASEEKVTLTSVKVIDEVGIEVQFSTKVRLSVNPLDNFIIAEKENSKNRLGVKSVVLNKKDESKVLVVTEPQSNVEYVIIASDIIGQDGSPIDLNQNTAQFKGLAGEGSPTPPPSTEDPDKDADADPTPPETDKTPDPITPPIEDKTAPTDISGLTAKMNEDNSVRLSWVASKDLSDVDDQVLYISTDGGKTYDRGRSVGALATKFDIKGLSTETTYTFKIAAKDEAGNESEGATVVAKVSTLPETGPGLATLALGSFAAAYGVQRRRKKKELAEQ